MCWPVIHPLQTVSSDRKTVRGYLRKLHREREEHRDKKKRNHYYSIDIDKKKNNNRETDRQSAVLYTLGVGWFAPDPFPSPGLAVLAFPPPTSRQHRSSPRWLQPASALLSLRTVQQPFSSHRLSLCNQSSSRPAPYRPTYSTICLALCVRACVCAGPENR